MLAVYQYPKCSTCRNALRWLDGHGVAYESIDIVETPPSLEQLEEALQKSGLPVTRLFNTSGQSYREGNYKERLKQLSVPEALRELSKDGKLIKRPLVFATERVLVGFDASAYEQALPVLRASR